MKKSHFEAKFTVSLTIYQNSSKKLKISLIKPINSSTKLKVSANPLGLLAENRSKKKPGF